MYVYRKSEPALWTVGSYLPDGKWEAESDHNTNEAAAAHTHWLNGGVDWLNERKNNPLVDRLKHHVTGAIERGEAKPIIEVPAKQLNKLRDHIFTGLEGLEKAAQLIKRIQDALGTAEEGDALVEVAMNAHRAEQALAHLERDLQDEHDIEEDGGPNEAMRWSTRIDELRGRRP